MRRPKSNFEPYPNPKNSQLGPQKKSKKDPKIKSKSNDRIEGNIENESCSTTWVDPKTVIEPYSDRQISLLGPQKTKKTTIKIKSILNVRIQGIIEN